MSLFTKPSIKRRLYLSFACMIGIMIFFAIVLTQQLNTVKNRYNNALENLTTRQQCIGNMGAILNRIRFVNMVSGTTEGESNFNVFESFLDQGYYLETMQSCLESYLAIVLTDSYLSEEELSVHVGIIDEIIYIINSHYIPSINAVENALDSGNREELNNALYLNFKVGSNLSNLVWQLRDRSFEYAAYTAEKMRHYSRVEEFLFLMAAVAGIVFAILLAIVLTYTIQKPISELRLAMSKISSGEVNYPIRMKYKDDIGHLSHDIADMVASLSEMVETSTAQNLRIEQQEIYEGQIKEALEEARKASEAKSDFIANTSHEIRTPMNSIIGYSELAMDDEMPDVTREYLNKINLNAKWLLNIIEDIMDFSKIESGKLELEAIPFDINEVLDNVRNSTALQVLDKDVTLNIHTTVNSGKRLVGDPVKLTQICINLLSNAIKFTNQGTVECVVTTIKKTDGNCVLKFEVNDTGIGMTQEQITKIFAPFVQGNSGTTRKYGGTGLGLAIVKQLVEAMGGNLNVDSTIEKGSRFSFTLSFKMVAPLDEMPEYASVTMDASVAKPYFNSIEVLVVDDNEMNQGVLCEHLKRVGLTPVIAENGQEAVDIVNKKISTKETLFGLIFMDIQMPVMDGIEASSIISAYDTGIPIIAMTAGVTKLSAEKDYRNYGMNGFLSKPFTTQELYKTLVKHLDPIKEVKLTTNEINNGTIFDKEMQIKFYKTYKDIFNRLSTAIYEGDLTLAHRLAHNLSSNAGTIKEVGLQMAAADVEKMLVNKQVFENIISALKIEVDLVIKKLAKIALDEPPASAKAPVNNDEAEIIFAELEPLLKAINIKSLDFIDKLATIPGTETLIEHIDNYDFRKALKVLNELKTSGRTE